MVQKIAALLVGFLVAFAASAAVVGLRAKLPAPVPPAAAAHDSAAGEGTAHTAERPDSATEDSVHVMRGADSTASTDSAAAGKHPAPVHASAPTSAPSTTQANADVKGETKVNAKVESAQKSAALDSAMVAGQEPVGFAVSPERRLAKIFTAMQPKDAARVLEQMSDGDVQAIIAMLGDRQAAAVLANFPPQRAAVISKLAMRGGAK
jgi:flagellar motility protein MotE (MotC chaperone)